MTYRNGSTIHAASRRVEPRNSTESMPITSSASTSSLMRIEPSSATMPVPTLAHIIQPKAYGETSRRSHQAVNIPA